MVMPRRTKASMARLMNREMPPYPMRTMSRVDRIEMAMKKTATAMDLTRMFAASLARGNRMSRLVVSMV